MFLLRALRTLVVTAGLLTGLPALAAPIEVTDVVGRTVTLKKPAQRVVLAQARHFPVLALIHDDPASILAGWSDEFKTSFANDYADYLKAFPSLARVPVVGRHTPDTFSVESSLAQRPDLVILTAAFAGLRKGANPSESPLIRQFEAAGVPVVVIDFFMDPFENTVPSLRLLGKALGREDQAEAFIEFYVQHMDGVAGLVMGKAERPPVFVHAHAGTTDCCYSPGVGTFNDMISFAGGHNIGADVIRNATGQLGFEYINSRNPTVYVATGTGATQRTGNGLDIGSTATPDAARVSLRSVIDRQGLGALQAVRTGNAHGVWHGFNDSPLHVVFIEALARWIDPVERANLSPQATLDEINKRFLPVPMRGTYLVDLTDAGAGASKP